MSLSLDLPKIMYTLHTHPPHSIALFVTDYIGTNNFALLLSHLKETENMLFNTAFDLSVNLYEVPEILGKTINFYVFVYP